MKNHLYRNKGNKNYFEFTFPEINSKLLKIICCHLAVRKGSLEYCFTVIILYN